MGVRLHELIALPELRLSVRAGADRLGREVRWVHTTELRDPSQYLEGGELILTTGIWRRSPRDSEPFVAALARSDVCALGYGLPTPDTRATPADLVDACERHGVPLLEVPHEQPFMAIAEAVFERMLERRQARLDRTVRLSERLLVAAHSGIGVTGLLRMIAERSPGAWLVGPTGRLLGWLGERPTADEAQDAARRARAAEQVPADAELADGRRAALFRATALGRTEAYLVWLESMASISQEDFDAIDQTLGFVALELAQQRAVRATEAHFARELIELIEAGEAAGAEASARLRALRLDPDGPMYVVACATDPSEPNTDLLAEPLRDLWDAQGVPAVVPTVRGLALAIVAAGDADARTLGRDARGALVRALPAGAGVGVGVGSRASSAIGLRRSLIEARHACRMALAGEARDGVATARDLSSHAVLFALHDDEVRTSFRSAVIGQVLDYDAANGTRLADTLKRFLRSNGQWQPTADDLSIHVNTLRQRLRRVEELTGRDLSSFEDRIDLYVALHA